MGAPKLKIIPKSNNVGGKELSPAEQAQLAQNAEDKKYIKVYIDKLKSKLKSDKETQKKAALIIESLLKKSK